MNLDWLIGRQCVAVSSAVSGVFTFDFGDCGINVACAWRIRAASGIALAHVDHGQPYGLGVPIDVSLAGPRLLDGKPVIAACADDNIGDIRIEFEGELVLEVFNDSSGFEAWTMSTPDKHMWVAASGGTISGWLSSRGDR